MLSHDLFGFFGMPKVVVSDNAPEFIALKDWLVYMGIRLVNTPPYNPARNGQAERSVKTIKDAIKSCEANLVISMFICKRFCRITGLAVEKYLRQKNY